MFEQIHFLVTLLPSFLAFILLTILFKKNPLFSGLFAILASLGALFGLSQLHLNHAGTQTVAWNWIPSLHINFSFFIDGLSLFFSWVILGMGLAIVVYALYYFKDHPEKLPRFFKYLFLFQFAMLLTIFADSLILLFIGWELTGLASFFLIGFYYEKPESQAGARMALLTTGLTGLVLLVGLVMIALGTGDWNLHSLLQYKGSINHIEWAALLILIGAFGKSAQFPFHYWLPNAMAAPTPVSSYLHSATMVKLGIFLCARLHPILSQAQIFQDSLQVVGLLSFLIGAYLALCSHDLKAVLAYSTVSQLGFLLLWYGLKDPGHVEHDFFHVLNHVFYKGSLFMMAGLIDICCGTRDIRKLGGLRKHMPLMAIAMVIAALCMAGFPLTTGFLSKELMLTELYQNFHISTYHQIQLIGFVLGAVFMFAFSLRLIFHVFWGKVELHPIKSPKLGFQIPILALVVCIITFGVYSKPLESFLHTLSITNWHSPHPHALALWHGINPALLTSLGVFVVGFIVFQILSRKLWPLVIHKLLRFDHAFEVTHQAIMTYSRKITHGLLGHKPFLYLSIVTSALTLLLLGFTTLLFQKTKLIGSFEQPDFVSIFASLIIVLGCLGTLLSKRSLLRLIFLSVTGFSITFFYVLYRAPDLALTQILIETISLVLILIFLFYLPKKNHLPKDCEKLSLKQQSWNALMACGMASLVFVGVLIAQTPVTTRIGNYYLKNTVELAQGHNAVNTILVDFRGYDTMGEISVLVIAMLGIIGLLMRKKRSLADELKGESK